MLSILKQKFSSFLLYRNPYILLSLLTTIALLTFSKFTMFLFETKQNSKQINLAKKKLQQRNKELSSQNLQVIEIPQTAHNLILNSDVTTLLDLLQKGEISSEQILLTYYKRAITIGKKLELLAESNFLEALQKAKECDRIRKLNPSSFKGHLFGVPISLQDCFIQQGLDCTAGLAHNCFKPSHEDGFTVRKLKEHGAIPFVRSNCAQAVMLNETVSNIWGWAENPWNQYRTTGGGAGGEAGLIAARCSPIGLGCDMDGGLRVAGLFCGVYGFKSGGRLSTKGVEVGWNGFQGERNVPVEIGPMGRSVADLRLVIKSLLEESKGGCLDKEGGTRSKTNFEERKNEKVSKCMGEIDGSIEMKTCEGKGEGMDPYVPFKGWNDSVFYDERRKRVGVVRNCEFFRLSNVSKRALVEVENALRNRKHEVVEIEIPFLKEVFLLGLQLFSAGLDWKAIDSIFKGEKLLLQNAERCKRSSLGRIARLMYVQYFKRWKCLPKEAEMLERCRVLSTHEYLLVSHKIRKYQEEFGKLWEGNKLDCLLMPGLAGPAYIHGKSKYFGAQGVYTVFANVMKLPCGVVPVTVVQENEQNYDQGNSGKFLDKSAREMDKNMKGSVGMPIGVQVIGMPFEDEKVMCVMRQIEEEIPFYKKYQFPV